MVSPTTFGASDTLRRLEESDPECRKFPRFKPQDDASAFALTA